MAERDPPDIPEATRRGAEDIYEEFLRGRAAGGSETLEELCRRYPQLEGPLRALDSLHARPQELPETGATAARDLFPPAAETGSGRPARPLPDSCASGDLVGDFRILGPAKRGGFSEVYPAEQKSPKRVVALKLIQPERATQEVLARFDLEQSALARMRHPSIAQVFAAGTAESGRPYVALEYIEGPPLVSFCDREALDIEQRIVLFLEVCDAVEHAHQKGIIHRDIKPSNVLVAAEPGGRAVPKVIDFGLAKSLNTRTGAAGDLTVAGSLLGTPQYMAPEQAGSEEGDIDTRADVYGLGVLLYELLAGAVPLEFKGPDLLSMLRVIREEEAAPPSRRLAALPRERAAAIARQRATDAASLGRRLRGDLTWILRKALAKERDRRYPSPQALADDLRRHLADQPVQAGPPGLPYRLGKLLRRRKKPLAAAAALLVAVAGLAAWLYLDTLGAARTAWERYLARDRDVRERRSEWENAREHHASWAPVWERADELAARDALQGAGAGAESVFHQTVAAVGGALRTPRLPGHASELSGILETLYARHYFEGLSGGAPLLRLLEELSLLGVLARERPGEPQTFSLRSEPPGAEVHLFRYQEHEARLVPFPFRPDPGALEPEDPTHQEVPLVVAAWPEPEGPFAAGDRVLVVGGERVRGRADLARALRTTGEDAPVDVRLLRAGAREETVSWVPFPAGVIEANRRALERAGSDPAALPAGRLVHEYFQLGFTFEGYPLAFRDENLLGATRAGGNLEATLPPGSYLLVLQKPGFAEARLPLAVPRSRPLGPVRLLREHEVPPGFVYVPEGIAAVGGDPKATDSLERAEEVIPGFFIGRHEVTQDEWLEFANDPEVLARTDTATGLARASPEVTRRSPAPPGRFRIAPRLPHGGDTLFWSFDVESGRWGFRSPRPDDPRAHWPAFDISHHAALEYIAWRNRKERREGKPWRYRLPSDLEWERAARGEDRRYHVWGDYLVWSFCVSLPGNFKRNIPPVGISPFDESPFGVRDLAGSVAEHTSDATLEGARYRAWRGGHHDAPDGYLFRAARRNGLLADQQYTFFGLRLAADLRQAAE